MHHPQGKAPPTARLTVPRLFYVKDCNRPSTDVRERLLVVDVGCWGVRDPVCCAVLCLTTTCRSLSDLWYR